mmetsp:Transcript_37560/g.60840  ORF Transcript_37560/g.60840 Transcript_37560/m.60840 type:complete len:262 (+) Transcript_37560:1258-2043(+)|eukprot:CAMPEP_0184649242 /NCGR_PEP_ID=MMETSP0308-20130426/6553_1 /TAXON_ID=38269 /ORGANISM="Gloeochaete witrockiana, Strain SAG 46.84" /LENGTH=261 /DNA_ID=CAMNT_0027081795 /DNA_START=154 /DNA_END=939 /DNA_ORIENTATION=-
MESTAGFVCPVAECGRVLARKDTLKAHLQHVKFHGFPSDQAEQLIKTVEPLKMLCDFVFSDGNRCTKSFVRKNALDLHRKGHFKYSTVFPATDSFHGGSAEDSFRQSDDPADTDNPCYSEAPPPPSSSTAGASQEETEGRLRRRDHNIEWTDELILDNDEHFERKLYAYWFSLNTRAIAKSSSTNSDGTKYKYYTCCVNGKDRSKTADDPTRTLGKNFDSYKLGKQNQCPWVARAQCAKNNKSWHIRVRNRHAFHLSKMSA